MPRPARAQPVVGDLEDFRWLTGSEAADLLRSTAASAQPLTVQVAQLRRHFSPERTHLLVGQIALRQRARAKFVAADRMFFTARGLEQASDEIIAGYKAARFGVGGRVFDLCAGIGGDLLALGQRGDVTGFDNDPILVTLAEANARIMRDEAIVSQRPAHDLSVSVADVRELDMSGCTAWHIDPDRRPTGGRTTRVELHEPGPEVIEILLAKNPRAAIKLAPAAELPASWSERVELEWISRARECRQLVAWFGDLASAPGRRRATILGSASTPLATVDGSPIEGPPAAAKIGHYVFEPDAAVLAARLSGTLAAKHGLLAIAPGLAYWTGDARIDDPALACFAVDEVFPFRLKPLKAWLRARSIGQLEIKKRGVDHDPEQLRRDLSLSGDAAATLLVTRIDRRVIAILARRLS